MLCGDDKATTFFRLEATLICFAHGLRQCFEQDHGPAGEGRRPPFA
jgi:hypothetical protein